jgi:hypothetical protein
MLAVLSSVWAISSSSSVILGLLLLSLVADVIVNNAVFKMSEAWLLLICGEVG